MITERKNSKTDKKSASRDKTSNSPNSANTSMRGSTMKIIGNKEPSGKKSTSRGKTSNSPNSANTSMRGSTMKTMGNKEISNGARRIGEGAKSIYNKIAAAVPYLWETTKQAAHDREINTLNKKFREAERQSDLQNARREHEYRKAERIAFPDLTNYKAAAAKAEKKKKILQQNSIATPVPMNNWSSEKMKLANEQQQKALGGLSPTAQFLGETAMSIGQNAATLIAAPIHPSAPLAIMGAMSAADKAYELTQKGVGAGEALRRGTVAGGIEAATEKFPLERIMRMGKGIAKSFVKNTLKQAGLEATEEGISYALNYLADLYSKDPEANFSAKDLAKAAAGGAVSGGIMAGGASALGTARSNKSKVENSVNETKSTNTVTENANSVNSDVDNVKTNKNGKISDAEMFEIIGGKTKEGNAPTKEQIKEQPREKPKNTAAWLKSIGVEEGGNRFATWNKNGVYLPVEVLGNAGNVNGVPSVFIKNRSTPVPLSELNQYQAPKTPVATPAPVAPLAILKKHDFAFSTLTEANAQLRAANRQIAELLETPKYKKSRQPLEIKIQHAQKELSIDLNRLYENAKAAKAFKDLPIDEKINLTRKNGVNDGISQKERREYDAYLRNMGFLNKAKLLSDKQLQAEIQRVRKKSWQQNGKISDAEMFEIIGGKVQEASKSTAEKDIKTADFNNFVDYSISKSRYTENPVVVDERLPNFSLGTVSERLRNDVLRDYNYDLKEYNHEISDNDLRHIFNRHGAHTNEKYPITAADLKNIPNIINGYDNVYLLDNKGNSGVVFEKRHNGVTYYLEAVDEGLHALVNKQMIKSSTGTIPDIKGLRNSVQNKKEHLTFPDDAAMAVPQMYVQDAGKVFLNDNLSQSNNSVNTHDTKNNESTVKTPYNGTKPTQEKIKTSVPKISDESLKTAQSQIEYAKSKGAETGKSTRSLLEGFYEQMFDSMGGARDISVDGVSFDSKPYVVTLNKNSVGKVISDSHLSAEKLSVFNNIDEIIKNGNYIESSAYVPHSKKTKLTVRFDYFETPVKIDSTDYIVRFDVEVFPSDNNYRVHKIINKMNLTPVLSANKAGPVPTATEKVSDSYETNLPQSNNSVNTHDTQNAENYSPKEENQQYTQEAPPQNGFYAYLKDLQERYHTTDDDMLFSYLSEEERSEYMRLRSLEEKESMESLMRDYDMDVMRIEKAKEAKEKSDIPQEELKLGKESGFEEFEKAMDEMQESAKYESELEELKNFAEQIEKKKHGHGLSNVDFFRALDRVSGGKKTLRDVLHRSIEKPMLAAKAAYTQHVKSNTAEISDIFTKLDIKAGSKESAAVQWLGEGAKPSSVAGETLPYTLANLKAEFPDSWERIDTAEKFCRKKYDQYILRLNEMLSTIYPNVQKNAEHYLDELNAKAADFHNKAIVQENLVNSLQRELNSCSENLKKLNPESVSTAKMQKKIVQLQSEIAAAKAEYSEFMTSEEQFSGRAQHQLERMQKGEHFKNKRVPFRRDYYHHFKEISDSLGGLKTVLNSSVDIDPHLVGKSEGTKPKAKFIPAMQRRSEKSIYTADAVGGLAKYMAAAEYKIAFDPMIAHLRKVASTIADATEETKNANDFIWFLGEYANTLAGKTNFIDRPFQKFLDRSIMLGIEKINNRLKSNLIVGNVNSALVQFGNLPNAAMYVTNPKAWAGGVKNFLKNPQLLEQSNFLNERYLSNDIDKLTFDGKILSNVEKFAGNMMEFGDKKAAQIIWNAAYYDFNTNGGNVKNNFRKYENAADYADDIARRSVGGRGVGETPLTQKSRIVGLFAPFQLEVNNTYHLLKEQIGEKNALGFLEMQVGNFVINSIIEFFSGNRPLPDFITAMLEIFKNLNREEEENEEKRTATTKLLESVSRFSGEAVSTVPYAQQLLPNFLNENITKALFGESDPSRYGTGTILANTIGKPIAQAAFKENIDIQTPLLTVLPKFGGKQLDRTLDALQDWGTAPFLRINTQKGINTEWNEFPASTNNAGNIRFVMDDTINNRIKNLLFGSFATTEGKQYIKSQKMPMTADASAEVRESFEKGIDPQRFLDFKSELSQKRKENNGLKNSEKFDAILNFGADDVGSEFLFKNVMDENEDERISGAVGAGVNANDYIRLRSDLFNADNVEGNSLTDSEKADILIDMHPKKDSIEFLFNDVLGKKPAAKMAEAKANGIDPEDYMKLKSKLGKVTKSGEKSQIILDFKASDQCKKYLFLENVSGADSDSMTKKIQHFEGAKIPFDYLLQCKVKYSEIDGTDYGNSTKKLKFDRWAKGLPLDPQQLDIILSDFTFSNFGPVKTEGLEKRITLAQGKGLTEDEFLEVYKIAKDKTLSGQEKIESVMRMKCKKGYMSRGLAIGAIEVAMKKRV